MRKHTAKYYLTLIAVFFVLVSNAGIITRNNSFNGTSITNNAILVLQEDLYTYTTANPNPFIWGFNDKKVDNRVFLRFTGANKTYYPTAWNVSVNVRIERFTKTGAALPVINTVLAINYDPTQPYQDIATYATTDGHRIKTTITGVSMSPNFGGVLPSDIVLENEIEIERYYNLPSILPGPPAINHGALQSNNSREIYWDYVLGAEEYDMEFVFVSQYVTPQPNVNTVDFSNATRISTMDNFYKLNLTFDNGTIFYRFRAVGVGGISLDQRLESEWINGSSSIVLSSNFHTASNWNYEASFAEGGKSSESLNFFDGSERVRQKVALNNSDNVSMITESFYDFEGRQALSTLPAPPSNLSNRLGYFPNFSLNGSNAFFTKNDFEDGNCSSNYPMSANEGASNYYSPSNVYFNTIAADKMFYPALPDAFLYPMVRTTYNNESEKLAISGVGVDYKIGSGKETVMFNASASQEKLDRIFGNEVGYAEHYTEEVTIDPNGQISVGFKNLSGKTVATCMRGEGPLNLTSLANQTNDEPYMNLEYTKEDMLSMNQLDATKNGFIASKDFLVTNAGPINSPNPYNFNYQITPQIFSVLCINTSFNCKYLLKISIDDNCGNPVNAIAPNANLLNTYIPIDPVLYPNGYNVNFTVYFPANGVYKIKKELILDPAYIQSYAAQYKALVKLPNSTCVTSYNTLLTNALNEVDAEECLTCAQYAEQKTVEWFVSQDLPVPPVGSQAWNTQYDIIYDKECQIDPPTKSCKPLFDNLVKDCSPGGQYFELTFPQGYVFTQQTPPNSWTANQAMGWIDALILINPGFITDFQNYASQVCSPPNNVIPNNVTHAWVVANWNDCFANFLYQYHPEYCRIERCYALHNSDDYDYLLQVLSYNNALNTDNTGNNCPNPPGCAVLDATIPPTFGSSVLFQDPVAQIYPQIVTPLQAQVNNCTSCAAMVNQNNNTCNNPVTMWDYALCVPVPANNLNDRWKNFVILYLSAKQNLLTPFMCPGVNDTSIPPDLLTDGYDPYNVNQTAPNPQKYILQNGMNIIDPDISNIIQNNVVILTSNPPNLPPGFGDEINQDSCTYIASYKDLTLSEAYFTDQCPVFDPSNTNAPFPGATNITCNNNIAPNGIQFWVTNVPTYAGQINISDRIDIPNNYQQLTDYNMLTLLANGINSYISNPDFAAAVDNTNPNNPKLKIIAPGFLSQQLLFPNPQIQLGVKRYENCTTFDNCSQKPFSAATRTCIDEYADCVCNLLQQLDDAYAVANPPIQVSLDQYMADQLNAQFYNNSPVITVAQVQYWFANCQNSGYTPYPTDNSNDEIEPLPNPPFLVPPQITCDPPCNEQAEQEATFAAETKFNSLIDAAVEAFIKSYVNTCLSNINEKFNVEYYEKEYHYTLYYYDQSGNLVRTVPPKGVNRIASAALYSGPNGSNIVHNARLANAAFIYTGHSRIGQVTNYPTPNITQAANNWVTNYKYNSYNQLKNQATPDAGPTNFWYDKLGRIRFSQNAKQAASTCYSGFCNGPTIGPFNGLYSYTMYDNLNRIIEVGENDIYYLQQVGTPPGPIALIGVSFPSGVDDQTFPSATGIQVTKTYYQQVISGNNVAGQFPGGQKNLRGRTASITYEDIEDANDNSYQHATHFSYDIQGNVNSMVQENPSLNNLSEQYKKIDYEYDLISNKTNKVSYQAGKGDQFYHKYYYDANNRITSAYSSQNSVIWNREARYFYYLHGPLARVETGNEKVQGTDFVYTLQGWMKLNNSSVINAGIDLGSDGNTINANQYMINQPNVHDNIARDAFGYSLDYYNTDYRSIQSGYHNVLTANISNNGAYNSTPGLFNGDIRSLTQAFLNPLNEQPVGILSRWYSYDQLNRLKITNNHLQTIVSNDLGTSLAPTANNDYAESFRYDANGNILVANRNGYTGGNFNNSMDNMTYLYPTNNNKLTAVTDIGDNNNDPNSNFGDIKNQSTNNYLYDQIGDLVEDVQSNIDNIEWTVYGKIKKITRFSANNVNVPDIEFNYDALGNRVSKISKPRVNGVLSTQDNWTYTYYVRDAKGNVMATYNRVYNLAFNNYFDIFTLTEQHIYGSQRIGVQNRSEMMITQQFGFGGFNPDNTLYPSSIFIPTPTSFDFNLVSNNLGNKSFELSNHLGNVITTISDRKLVYTTNNTTIDYFGSDVLQSTDYYAFGAAMPGRQFNNGSYRYGFNGKENDNEIKGIGNSLDFGSRVHDPRLGRFLSTDPLQAKYPNKTPYHFASDNPTNRVDIDGEDDFNFYYVTITAKVPQPGGGMKVVPVSSYAFYTVEKNNKKNTYTVHNVSRMDDKMQKGKMLDDQEKVTGSTAGKLLLSFDVSSKDYKPTIDVKGGGRPNDIEVWDLVHTAKAVIKAEKEKEEVNQMMGLVASFVVPELLGAIAEGYQMAKLAQIAKGGSNGGKLQPLGLGSTGRTIAKNLPEQMAMDAVMENPSIATEIMEGQTMADARWQGWVKMEYKVKTEKGINAIVHFVAKVENGVIKAVDDFKFKDSKPIKP